MQGSTASGSFSLSARHTTLLVQGLLLALLVAGVVFPLCVLLRQAFVDVSGTFTGLGVFTDYISSFKPLAALLHTLGVGVVSALGTVFLAFIPAWSATHDRLLGKRVCTAACMVTLFVPSILPAIGLVYLLGGQGLLSGLILDGEIYGFIGIILGSVAYTLPHAFLLLYTSLRGINPDLYRAARTLGAGPFRVFCTVTLPGCRYGLLCALVVAFILSITDFGVPKVLGGEFSMLSTEIFQLFIGMQDFSKGAVASMLLLLPSIPAFCLDHWARKKEAAQRMVGTVSREDGQGAHFSTFPPNTAEPRKAGQVRFSPAMQKGLCTLASWLVAAFPLCIVLVVVFSSFTSFWPYDLNLTLSAYSFDTTFYGIAPYFNSVKLALAVALAGTTLTFVGAYLARRSDGFFRTAYNALALVPLCVPGTVLGLAYAVGASRVPGFMAPLLDGGIVLLTLNTVIHFYTVCHFTCLAGLDKFGADFEAVGATLGTPRYRTFFRVTLPLQAQTLMDTAFYLFVNALTTLSAVVFIYSAHNTPASVAVMQLFDSGQMTEASALGTLILITAFAAKAAQLFFSGRRSAR